MCVLFCCFKMKVPRSPLPGKSLEQAWKASEAEGVRACGERASAQLPGAKRGETRRGEEARRGEGGCSGPSG